MAEFAASAARLAGLAGALLGWRPDEFWKATPAELATVFQAVIGEGEAVATPVDLERLTRMFPDQPHRSGTSMGTPEKNDG